MSLEEANRCQMTMVVLAVVCFATPLPFFACFFSTKKKQHPHTCAQKHTLPSFSLVLVSQHGMDKALRDQLASCMEAHERADGSFLVGTKKGCPCLCGLRRNGQPLRASRKSALSAAFHGLQHRPQSTCGSVSLVFQALCWCPLMISFFFFICLFIVFVLW